MDNGREEGPRRGKWLSFSLEQKMRCVTVSAAAVVILSIAANVLVAGFGMRGFNAVLKSNSRSLSFWSAMEKESGAFVSYVRERTGENKERYEAACQETARALASLPLDYEKTGARQYALTWSVQNMYENYAAARNAFWNMEEGQEAYTDALYRIYRVQGYLSTGAGRLEQMTVESGNDRYESQRPLLVIVPVVSILWGGAALCLVRLLSRSVHRNIVRPLVLLAEDSRRIGDNDFSGPEIQAQGRDEIASLVQAFCAMKASTRGYIEAMREKHEMEKQLDAVRLQMLKNQINPHFLFNTLNMIASTAQIEDAKATEKMINALSRLFRYNLKSTESVMPLEREMKVVQDYMYLQTMRFGPRIRYSADCGSDTLDVLVPSFALQPLVENAIKHGISPKGPGGRIHVRAWMDGERLRISVADTGVGMTKERLEDIRRALAQGDEKGTGVGIGNIYRRVQGMYRDGNVSIYSCLGHGTVVQLTFTPR